MEVESSEDANDMAQLTQLREPGFYLFCEFGVIRWDDYLARMTRRIQGRYETEIRTEGGKLSLWTRRRTPREPVVMTTDPE